MTQLYTSKKACSCIPSGVLIHSSIKINSDPVILSKCNAVCQVYIKGCIAVVMSCNFISIDIYGGIGHSTVKIKAYTVIFPLIRYHYLFGIVYKASLIIAHIKTSGRILRYIAFNHGIMRKINKYALAILSCNCHIKKSLPIFPSLIQ